MSNYTEKTIIKNYISRHIEFIDLIICVIMQEAYSQWQILHSLVSGGAAAR